MTTYTIGKCRIARCILAEEVIPGGSELTGFAPFYINPFNKIKLQECKRTKFTADPARQTTRHEYTYECILIGDQENLLDKIQLCCPYLA